MNTTTTTTASPLESISELNIADNAADSQELSLAKEILPAQQYQEEIDKVLVELDELDSNAIIHFGSKAQEQVTAISDQMLSGVKSKDSGPAGEMLSEMIVVLRGFDMEKLDPNKKQSWLDKLLNRAKPIAKFQQGYEEVNDQVETISNALEKHKEALLHDIKSLDKLYEANLEYFHNLDFYIDAGEKKLQLLDGNEIPALAQIAEQSDDMVDVQKLKDLRNMRDDLERRIHDLRLTRQVAMQSLPSIRLVQSNDKGLVTKINSTLINTIPLWRQQLAQSIAIYRSSQAADTLKAATDLTNDLLEANAENLNQASAQARRQIERGVFDIESVKKANDTLIKTIEESLQISAEGKKARHEALITLEKTESELKQALRQAAAKELDDKNSRETTSQ